MNVSRQYIHSCFIRQLREYIYTIYDSRSNVKRLWWYVHRVKCMCEDWGLGNHTHHFPWDIGIHKLHMIINWSNGQSLPTCSTLFVRASSIVIRNKLMLIIFICWRIVLGRAFTHKGVVGPTLSPKRPTWKPRSYTENDIWPKLICTRSNLISWASLPWNQGWWCTYLHTKKVAMSVLVQAFARHV